MTKRELMTLFDSQTELAEFLGITPQAVYQWKQDDEIPRPQYMRLRYELMPDAFRRDGTLKARA